MTIPVVRKRAKKPKTRTGCRTCRQRHIKCDEERPACRRCRISGRECDGYEIGLALQAPRNPVNLLPKNIQLQQGVFQIAPAPNGLPFEFSPIEMQAYDFFRTQTAQQLPGTSWAPSWEGLALQVGQREPAVMHAMIAVGSIHQWCSASLDAKSFHSRVTHWKSLDTQQHEFAISQYNKSMSYMREYIKEIWSGGSSDTNIEIVLLVCLLFVCFEILQDGDASAVIHLRTGLRILYDRVSRDEGGSLDSNPESYPSFDIRRRRSVCLKASPESMIDVLLHTFVQIDSDLTLFGMQEPYLHPTCGSGIPSSFQTIGEARLHLNVLASTAHHTRGAFLQLAEYRLKEQETDHSSMDEDAYYCLKHATSRTVALPDPSLVTQMHEMRRDLAAWMSALAFIPASADKEAQRAHLLVQIQFFFIWLLVSTWRDTSEMMCDRFEDQFAHVLNLAERYMSLSTEDTSPQSSAPTPSSASSLETMPMSGPKFPFTLGTGILPCVYIVAVKCRKSSIRRRALALLQSVSVQGLLDSFVLATFTQRIVDLEEARARTMGGYSADFTDFQCHDVPEAARFVDVTLAGASMPSVGRLVWATHREWPSGELIIEEDFFELDLAS